MHRFRKTQDYSVVEDSSVRVHVCQLRLKLHGYFDGDGIVVLKTADHSELLSR